MIVGVGQDKVRTLVRALQKSHPRTHIGTAHAPAARRRVPREKRADIFVSSLHSLALAFFIYLRAAGLGACVAYRSSKVYRVCSQGVL